jgi:hypothetical protein
VGALERRARATDRTASIQHTAIDGSALHTYAERRLRSVNDARVPRLILCGAGSPRHTLHEYAYHYHHEGNHQGNELLLIRKAMTEGAKAKTVTPRVRSIPEIIRAQACKNFLTSGGDSECNQPFGNHGMGVAHHAGHQVPDRLNGID